MDEFTPRDYQVELLQAALDNDIIVYLPTGSGKTFIAALLIKEKSSEVTLPLAQKGKRTVFLVPTVVLAIQQASYLRRHTHLKVKEYYGSMGVDLWSGNQWAIEFESNNVLVMTAQIFVDILNHAYFFIHQVNLLIFDECHAAVKDAPMKQVLAKLDKCKISQRPKILGLTAALFRKRCKPSQVLSVITQLSESMKCQVKTPNDIQTVYRNSTKPCELILQYPDDNGTVQIEDFRLLSKKILESIAELNKELIVRYHSSAAKAEKTDKLFDPLKEILFLLESFGPYGAYHSALFYIENLPGVKGGSKKLSTDLEKVVNLCKKIRDRCVSCFQKYQDKDRLLLFIQPRIVCLLDLIRKFNPNSLDSGKNFDGAKPAKMCGIIFVERRCMANVLYQFLKDIAIHDETLGFIKPLFTMGQAAGGSGLLKESRVLNMKQNEIMKQFREGLCNLLIATSVLEEGIDIPVCNVIIRFDEIKTYCDYVQTKGRARASKAFYCILVNESDTETCLQSLMEFHSIEQQLINTTDFEEELDIDHLCSQIIEPYAPYGESGPGVTLQSGISLVNRYCSQLTPREGLILAPKWTLNTVKSDQIEPNWLKKLDKMLKQLPPPSPTTATNIGEFFKCSILLPLNSPLREEIVGQVMPTKRLAKKAAALKMCIKLHELRELDDLHLLPVRHQKLDDVKTLIAVAEEETVGTPTVESGDTFYDRQFPACLTYNRPTAGQSVFIYAIEYKLIKDSNGNIPLAVDTKLAIMSSCVIPAIGPFPMVTNSGVFQIDLVGVSCVILDRNQLEKIAQFHRFLFQDVIFLKKQNLEFDLDSSKLKYLITPLTAVNEIDFEFIDRMVNHKLDWDQPHNKPGSFFDFDPSVYIDAVVIPSYRPFGTINTFHVDSVTDLTPSSTFPDAPSKDFASYFREKYQLEVTNPNQRLLKVSSENFPTPRFLTSKEEKTIHLVPEFCFVHPLPTSVWKQMVWLPSILHRLNGLLVAEEFRTLINKETLILELDFNLDQLNESMDLITFNDTLQLPWNSREATKQHSFDMESRECVSKFVPSPSLILEALTLNKSVDGFGMGRLQILGDSIVKLVIGIYVYGNLASKHLDEDRLSHLRMQQINTQNLFRLGQHKNIGRFISGHSFDLDQNFLTPGFRTPENSGASDLHLQQWITANNIADSMEALIGVYLLSTGIKGSIMVMNWMGLKTLPDMTQQFNKANGFPVIPPSPLPTALIVAEEFSEIYGRLYAGLDLFENHLGHVFKNKLLLIEALTHASYFPNRLTDCYQRLEFLGGAVLDYLMTRFYYNHPHELTDLRSALVNDETFAVIAVRNHFHLYLKHQSLTLSFMVDGFVRAQEENGHLLTNDIASIVDVPKVLSDIFKSVAGAIFVDSEMTLDAVWKCFLPFLNADMEKLNHRIPRSPVGEMAP